MRYPKVATIGCWILVQILILGSHLAQAQQPWRFTKLDDLPNSVGVASPFAGRSGSALLVAGGANFPDKKPWEGGKKVWHDQVYALEQREGKWIPVGTLPKPLAYGVSATYNDRILCVGGSDADAHSRSVFQLRYRDSTLTTEPLADLPTPIANACGSIVDGVLIVTGGLERPDATECQGQTWALDLRTPSSQSSTPEWRALAPIPSAARMLSTAATDGNSLWVLGGVTLRAGPDGKPVREYLRECWKLELDRTSLTGHWSRQADLPTALAASPGPAIVQDGYLWVFGGDDGTQVGTGPSEHRGFSKRIFALNLKENRWSESSQVLPVARVTVPLTSWSDGWVISSGEAKPGIRSAEVWWASNEPTP